MTQIKAIQTNHPSFLMNIGRPLTATPPKTPHFPRSTRLLTRCVNFGMIAEYPRHPGRPSTMFFRGKYQFEAWHKTCVQLWQYAMAIDVAVAELRRQKDVQPEKT